MPAARHATPAHADEIPAWFVWASLAVVAGPSFWVLAYFQHRLFADLWPGTPNAMTYSIAVAVDSFGIASGVYWFRSRRNLHIRAWGRTGAIVAVLGSTALTCWAIERAFGGTAAIAGVIPAAIVFWMTKQVTQWQADRKANRDVLAEAAAQVDAAEAERDEQAAALAEVRAELAQARAIQAAQYQYPAAGREPADLYRLFNRKDELLYVGVAREVNARMREHRDETPWFSAVTRIERTPYGDRPSAEYAEQVAIEQEQPAYNVMSRSGPQITDPDWRPTEPTGPTEPLPLPPEKRVMRPANGPALAVVKSSGDKAQTSTQANESILAGLREWAADPDRPEPTRNAVMREFGIGTNRASRLLAAVQDEMTASGPDQAAGT